MAVWLAVCMFWSCYAGMSYWHTCAVSGVQCHGVWCDGVQLLMHGHSYGSLTCTAPPSHSFIVTACSLPLSPTPLFARMEPTTHRSWTLIYWYGIRAQCVGGHLLNCLCHHPYLGFFSIAHVKILNFSLPNNFAVLLSLHLITFYFSGSLSTSKGHTPLVAAMR